MIGRGGGRYGFDEIEKRRNQCRSCFFLRLTCADFRKQIHRYLRPCRRRIPLKKFASPVPILRIRLGGVSSSNNWADNCTNILSKPEQTSSLSPSSDNFLLRRENSSSICDRSSFIGSYSAMILRGCWGF